MIEQIIHDLIVFLLPAIHNNIQHVTAQEMNATGINMTGYNNQAFQIVMRQIYN